MTIVEQRCPRCAIRRTLSLGEWGAFCCNCRLQWNAPARTRDIDFRTRTADANPQPFEHAELARLERYRMAIERGIYTDWPAPSAVDLHH